MRHFKNPCVMVWLHVSCHPNDLVCHSAILVLLSPPSLTKGKLRQKNRRHLVLVSQHSGHVKPWTLGFSWCIQLACLTKARSHVEWIHVGGESHRLAYCFPPPWTHQNHCNKQTPRDLHRLASAPSSVSFFPATAPWQSQATLYSSFNKTEEWHGKQGTPPVLPGMNVQADSSPFKWFCLQRFALPCLPALPQVPTPAPDAVLPSPCAAVVICEAWAELWQGRDVIKPRREEMSAAMQASSWHSTFKRFQKRHSDDFRLGRPVSSDGGLSQLLGPLRTQPRPHAHTATRHYFYATPRQISLNAAGSVKLWRQVKALTFRGFLCNANEPER